MLLMTLRALDVAWAGAVLLLMCTVIWVLTPATAVRWLAIAFALVLASPLMYLQFRVQRSRKAREVDDGKR